MSRALVIVVAGLACLCTYGSVRLEDRGVIGAGKVPRAQTLLLSDGLVIAQDGRLLRAFWLDAEEDECAISDTKCWVIGNVWKGKVFSGDKSDGTFYYQCEDGTWGFDPSITIWTQRHRRMYLTERKISKKANEAVLGSYLAVAERDELVVRNQSACIVFRLPVQLTAVDAEGNWLVGFDPEKRSIRRYRMMEE